MSEFTGEFTVASWNILYDHSEASPVLPQSERYRDFARTLLSLNKELDIVALYEVDSSDNQGSYGEKIAKLTGNSPGRWQQHSREHEQIGMFGKATGDVEFVELDHYKTAAITTLGTISVAGVHLTFDLCGSYQRSRQVQVLLDKLSDKSQALIMGDFNSLPWQRPRRLIEANGFQSVFSVLGMTRPLTAPIHEYRHSLKRWQRILVRNGFSVDDIYVKGLEVKDAGTFKGDSDHLGVWATLVQA